MVVVVVVVQFQGLRLSSCGILAQSFGRREIFSEQLIICSVSSCLWLIEQQ